LEQVNEAIDQIKPRKIFATDNVGRDVYPFLFASRSVLDDGYKYVCKIHSKKSTHRVDGNAWRTNLLTGLLSQEALDFLDEAFFDGRKNSPGIAAPHSAFLSLSVNKYVAGNIAELNRLKSAFELDDFRSGEFIAGTMFWLDFQLFRDVFERLWTPEDFGDDLGQVDGTLAHAFERFFALYAKSKNRLAIKIPQSQVEFDVNRKIEEGA
jgi:lipopolysaccharide biosynthesis protein